MELHIARTKERDRRHAAAVKHIHGAAVIGQPGIAPGSRRHKFPHGQPPRRDHRLIPMLHDRQRFFNPGKLAFHAEKHRPIALLREMIRRPAETGRRPVFRFHGTADRQAEQVIRSIMDAVFAEKFRRRFFPFPGHKRLHAMILRVLHAHVTQNTEVFLRRVTVFPFHQQNPVHEKTVKPRPRFSRPEFRLHGQSRQGCPRCPVKHEEDVRPLPSYFFPQIPGCFHPHVRPVGRNDVIHIRIVPHRVHKPGIYNKGYLRALRFPAEHFQKRRQRNHVAEIEHVDHNDLFIFQINLIPDHYFFCSRIFSMVCVVE